MSEINHSGFAFPLGANEHGGHGSDPGMTLRDYFASQADISAYRPVATLEKKNGRLPTMLEVAEYVAQLRWMEADVMIRAREAS